MKRKLSATESAYGFSVLADVRNHEDLAHGAPGLSSNVGARISEAPAELYLLLVREGLLAKQEQKVLPQRAPQLEYFCAEGTARRHNLHERRL